MVISDMSLSIFFGVESALTIAVVTFNNYFSAMFILLVR